MRQAVRPGSPWRRAAATVSCMASTWMTRWLRPPGSTAPRRGSWTSSMVTNSSSGSLSIVRLPNSVSGTFSEHLVPEPGVERERPVQVGHPDAEVQGSHRCPLDRSSTTVGGHVTNVTREVEHSCSVPAWSPCSPPSRWPRSVSWSTPPMPRPRRRPRSSRRPRPQPRRRYHATVRFTEHGIPHITANDFGSLGFGSGYAAAEASICNLADTLVTARGQRSRWFGPNERATTTRSRWRAPTCRSTRSSPTCTTGGWSRSC